MPIFDIHGHRCGYRGQALVLFPDSPLECPGCGESHPEKPMPPSSTLSGGSRPTEAGCAGPGSCCGRTRG